MPYDKDEQSYLSQLGARIRKLRKARKLSQEALAFEAGLDRTYVSSVERGERNIAVLNLAKLARALGVEVAELLGEEGVGLAD
jgi:transcriptional regulator with XRE-family HTH domain